MATTTNKEDAANGNPIDAWADIKHLLPAQAQPC